MAMDAKPARKALKAIKVGLSIFQLEYFYNWKTCFAKVVLKL